MTKAPTRKCARVVTVVAGATGLLSLGAAPAMAGPLTTALQPVTEPVRDTVSQTLPAACSELYTQLPEAYTTCHQAVNSLALNGNNIRYWLFEPCYKPDPPAVCDL